MLVVVYFIGNKFPKNKKIVSIINLLSLNRTATINVVALYSLQSQQTQSVAAPTSTNTNLSCHCTDKSMNPVCGTPISGSGIIIEFANMCAFTIFNCLNPESSLVYICGNNLNNYFIPYYLLEYQIKTGVTCDNLDINTASIPVPSAIASKISLVSGVPFASKPQYPSIPSSLLKSTSNHSATASFIPTAYISTKSVTTLDDGYDPSNGKTASQFIPKIQSAGSVISN